MKISPGIDFKSFKTTKPISKILTILKKILKSENQIIDSFKKSYKNSYTKKTILRLERYSEINLIGMGGSILGARSIYSFLKDRIKKNFFFIDKLDTQKKDIIKKKSLNLIISKSGNTLETITNSNIFI